MRAACLILLAAVGSAQTTKILTLAEAEAIATRNHPRVNSLLLNAGATDAVTKQIAAARYPTLSSNITGVGAQNNTSTAAGALNPAQFSVTTRFFEVRGRLRMESTVIEEHSLLQRDGMDVRPLWIERAALDPRTLAQQPP